MKLFETVEQIEECFAGIGEANKTGDADAVEAWMTTLESLQYDMAETAEWIVKGMKNDEAEIAGLKEVIKQFQDRVKTAERRIDSRKNYLKDCMTRAGLKKMDAGVFKLSIAKNGGVAPLMVMCDPDQLPDKYRKVSYTADNEQIRKDLEAGEELGFARLGERGESLRVK